MAATLTIGMHVARVLHIYISIRPLFYSYNYRLNTALFILANMMVINCFVVCPTEKRGHVIIITSYKHSNGSA